MYIGPHTLRHLHGLDSGEGVLRSSCGALFGNIKISDLDFADVAVTFAETLDPLMGSLDVLNEESEPLG